MVSISRSGPCRDNDTPGKPNDSRAEAEEIALAEPNTKAGYRTMKLYPWQCTEGDTNIAISFTNGTIKVDRRSYLLDNG